VFLEGFSRNVARGGRDRLPGHLWMENDLCRPKRIEPGIRAGGYTALARRLPALEIEALGAC
jgi:hypothetical protein